MTTVWHESFAASAAHLSQETASGDGDVNAFFVHAHFIVERAREKLLWSWSLGRVGALNGTWGEAEARRAWGKIGGAWGGANCSSRPATWIRSQGMGSRGPEGERISASELDFIFIFISRRLRIRWSRCRIFYEKCFAMKHLESEGEHPPGSEIFADIAFRNEACGDCGMRLSCPLFGGTSVVMALTKTSGSHGLSAFLPAPDHVLPPVGTEDGDREVPHLPLLAYFSLNAVTGMKLELNVRQWVMQLLQRYHYVIGRAPSLFERVSSAQGAAQVVAYIERMPNAALLYINDNAAKQSLTTQLTPVLETWFDRRWKTLSARE
ncbi:uncharacterized protein LAESUDRAFT_762057 [Laetiporus sulphureus 93-53]|uniref:Uncharacterized protein n=1 Tax=Laetiporus sulphureus 93-53 TaxID=1314785 RepID=A0A165CR40_9APHY|nr:uncharacterized protein LAESUDRAFT_762057 [Laetiporus sulphureus 93-53]KZT03274.1 hypothetical protein LAESUDRAFT_762057 [Laetiporus sulphureus 93-53]